MDKEKKEFDPAELLGGVLNILGLKIDLGELLGSAENLQQRLEELGEKLEEAGGEGVQVSKEWIKGHATVSGYVRTHGLLGEQEFHVGTLGKSRRKATKGSPQPAEPVEPPVDVFDEGDHVTVVADVPGVSLEDVAVSVEGHNIRLATKPTAQRRFLKELRLDSELEPDSIQTSCRNGVLEVKVRKRGQGKASP